MCALFEADVVEPFEQLVAQNHTRAANPLQFFEIELLLRHYPSLHQLTHPSWACSEEGGLLLLHDSEQGLEIGYEGASIVEDGPPAAEQVAHAGEVHDPSSRGVLQSDVCGLEVAMQHRFLAEVEQDGPGGVDDGLGDAGRSRGVVYDHGSLEVKPDCFRGGSGLRR